MPDVVLPDIRVEAGFSSSDPTSGTGLLILDDPVYGKLDSGALASSINWTDISDYVKNFSIIRDSTRQQGPIWKFNGGTSSITLDNSDGRFDPDNLSGPYVSSGVTQVHPMIPIRIRAIFGNSTYDLFTGFADSWNPAAITSYTDYTEITLQASDAFKVLTGITLATASSTGAGDHSGARIRTLLSKANWYTSTEWMVIDNGDIQLQATTFGNDVLSLMREVALAEIGQLYVNGAGAVVFRARSAVLTDSRSAKVQAVFGDSPGTVHTAGTELYCASITRADDDTTIANDIQATRTGGSLQEVKDTASITKFLFPRTFTQSNLALQTDNDALTWVRWILHISANDENRFESIVIDPQADVTTLWPQVLGRLMGDRIQVWARPPQVSAPISKDCFIMGIKHTFDTTTAVWNTTWTLQSADKYGSFLVLNDANTGRLDFNALT